MFSRTESDEHEYEVGKEWYGEFAQVLWMVILMTILIYVAAVGMRIFTKNIADEWSDDMANPDSTLLTKGLGRRWYLGIS